MVFWFGVLVERFRSFNASRSDVISSNHFIFHHCIFQICRYQLNQTIFWIANFSKFSYQLWKSDFFRTMWIKYPSFFFHLKSITLVNEKKKSFRQISFYIIERDFILRLTTKYKEVIYQLLNYLLNLLKECICKYHGFNSLQITKIKNLSLWKSAWCPWPLLRLNKTYQMQIKIS